MSSGDNNKLHWLCKLVLTSQILYKRSISCWPPPLTPAQASMFMKALNRLYKFHMLFGGGKLH